MKKYGVVALGELLIDFIQHGVSDQGNFLFEANPGGAPCNVLSMLSNLGNSTAFIGVVGADQFGHILVETVKQKGIDTSAVTFHDSVPTTLAFIHRLANGDRDFSFYRNPGADMMLDNSHLDEELLRNTRVFHFGTLSMTTAKGRKATRKAVSIAKEAGAKISFDPNLRPLLWDDLDEARKCIEYGLSVADIVKISDNEVEFVLQDDATYKNPEQGLVTLNQRYPGKIAFTVTLGKEGSYSLLHDGKVEIKQEGFPVDSVDTTGAGDTFTALQLDAYLSGKLIATQSESVMRQAYARANAAGALITLRKGALNSMPTAEEVDSFMIEQKKGKPSVRTTRNSSRIKF